MRRFCSSIFSFFLILLILLSFLGCAGNVKPSKTVLLDALFAQVSRTLTSVKSLYPDDFEGISDLSDLKIEGSEIINANDKELLRVWGHFKLRFNDGQINRVTPFELFLEKGVKGESWRLARPSEYIDGEISAWMSYPLPIK